MIIRYPNAPFGKPIFPKSPIFSQTPYFSSTSPSAYSISLKALFSPQKPCFYPNTTSAHSFPLRVRLYLLPSKIGCAIFISRLMIVVRSALFLSMTCRSAIYRVVGNVCKRECHSPAGQFGNSPSPSLYYCTLIQNKLNRTFFQLLRNCKRKLNQRFNVQLGNFASQLYLFVLRSTMNRLNYLKIVHCVLLI